MRDVVLSADDLNAYLAEVFPQVDGRMRVEAVAPMEARMRLLVSEQDLRPGGTISGPSMFMLADCAFYVATLAMIGKEPLTVTVGATLNFLRKPAPTGMTATARILKLGRSLSVGDVTLLSDGSADPVAHATMTYSIPPK